MHLMNTLVLDNIQCEINLKKLQEKLHIKEDSPYFPEIRKLVHEAQFLARPKAVYKTTSIEAKENRSVVIDGIEFSSSILRSNLEETSVVYPFVITCGVEIEEWSRQFDDFFLVYCADVIKEIILNSARERFEAFLDETFKLGHAANMYPGSLPDWPISEQKPLFKLLDPVEELIGAQLTDSYLILPMKSVSGIRFPNKASFESCQLCPREKCPNRKAPYNHEVVMKFDNP